MRLIAKLEQEAANADSIFRRALAREDLVRLAKLRELAREEPALADFLKHGLFIGWTKDDLRTGELKAQLEPLMVAIFGYERGPSEEAEAHIERTWGTFHAQRMKILVHCL